ncbi:hypothetical protein B0T26DRAFT_675928 [Lasiosphaeria miniovina]|uniref:Uncharacterized protein n=1 Tax=Lasiosphaeria miniovina TaxID=1954250 RepID=A0AA40DXV4_9PEZI|nr:uncharacterized protein B0T26DRAFT_675928 [Lasiosphaeria miniovina]KAK0717652.1 hypothetical protein B0T26DRAFT_675928 [Lasiosphaeria miniovina]
MTYGGPDAWHQAMFFLRLMWKLSPLPPDWQIKWDAMTKDDADVRKEAARLEQHAPITQTFESRRRAIIAYCNESEYYEKDDYTEDELESLACLLPVMQDLMQYKPEDRMSAEQARLLIQQKWSDRRLWFDKEDGSENVESCSGNQSRHGNGFKRREDKKNIQHQGFAGRHRPNY